MENIKRETVLSHKNYYVERIPVNGKIIYALFEVEMIPQRTYIQSFDDFKDAREEFRILTGK